MSICQKLVLNSLIIFALELVLVSWSALIPLELVLVSWSALIPFAKEFQSRQIELMGICISEEILVPISVKVQFQSTHTLNALYRIEYLPYH